jgi:hypothetical protein
MTDQALAEVIRRGVDRMARAAIMQRFRPSWENANELGKQYGALKALMRSVVYPRIGDPRIAPTDFMGRKAGGKFAPKQAKGPQGAALRSAVASFIKIRDDNIDLIRVAAGFEFRGLPPGYRIDGGRAGGRIGGKPATPTVGRMTGGPVAAGVAYKVGENGPETLVLGQPGYVVNSRQTRQGDQSTSTSTKSTSITNNFTIQSTDPKRSAEETVRRQRAALIHAGLR